MNDYFVNLSYVDTLQLSHLTNHSSCINVTSWNTQLMLGTIKECTYYSRTWINEIAGDTIFIAISFLFENSEWTKTTNTECVV